MRIIKIASNVVCEQNNSAIKNVFMYSVDKIAVKDLICGTD